MSEPSQQQRGKAALVTGAASGIGKATVARLLADPEMRVIALDRSEPGLVELRSTLPTARIIPCEFDLSQTALIDSVAKKLILEHGAITYLVNNAGVWTGAEIVELSDQDWALTFD